MRDGERYVRQTRSSKRPSERASEWVSWMAFEMLVYLFGVEFLKNVIMSFYENKLKFTNSCCLLNAIISLQRHLAVLIPHACEIRRTQINLLQLDVRGVLQAALCMCFVLLLTVRLILSGGVTTPPLRHDFCLSFHLPLRCLSPAPHSYSLRHTHTHITKFISPFRFAKNRMRVEKEYVCLCLCIKCLLLSTVWSEVFLVLLSSLGIVSLWQIIRRSV